MEEIEKVVVQHTEQIKTLFANQAQQGKLIDTVNELALSVKGLALGQQNLSTTVTGLKRDVDEIKSKPGRRWDSMVEKIAWAVIAAVLGVILGKFGL